MPLSEELLIQLEQVVYNNTTTLVRLVTQEGDELDIEFVSEDEFLERNLHED